MSPRHKLVASVCVLLAVWIWPHLVVGQCAGSISEPGLGVFAIDSSPIIVLDPLGFYVPAGRDIFLTKMQVAAEAVLLREDELRRRLARNQNLWYIAQQADQGGDMTVAARIYQRLSLSRPRTEVTVSAQQRLMQIQSEAQSKLQELEDQLNSVSGRSNVPSALKRVDVDAEQVIRVFAELDKLALEYAGATSIQNKIQERVDQLRKQKQFAAILQEPVASELWKVGQKHEQQQKLCCAFLAYEQAAYLAPAPSAEQAKARLKQLQADDTVVASAQQCKNLQMCHEKYRRAQVIKTALPDRARAYFSEILEIAPPDTSIHKAAREQIASLK